MHTRLFAHDPRLDGNAYGFWERTYNSLRTLTHGGDTIIFHSLLVIIPEKNFGFFVSYNSIGGEGAPRNQLAEAILNRYFPAKDETRPKPPKDFKKRAKKYTGVYTITRVNTTGFAKMMKLILTLNISATDNNTLMVAPFGSEARQYVETAPLVFREWNGQDTIIFLEDGKGRITGLLMNNNPMIAGIRLSGFETPTSQFMFLSISMLLILSTWIWPIGALRRKLCRNIK
jgi:hypothetical protein